MQTMHGRHISSESREQLMCSLHGWHLLAISFVRMHRMRIGIDISRRLKFMHHSWLLSWYFRTELSNLRGGPVFGNYKQRCMLELHERQVHFNDRCCIVIVLHFMCCRSVRT